MDTDQAPHRCTRCGSAIQGGELGGLCPSCLLALAAPGSLLSEPAEPTGLVGSSSEGRADLRLAPGQVFGRFRIECLLGRGGMGEVYAAEQTDDGRRVALKVLSERLADPRDRARFLRSWLRRTAFADHSIGSREGFSERIPETLTNAGVFSATLARATI